MENKIIHVILIGLFSINLYSQDCDTIYGPNKFYKGAEFKDGMTGIYQYMGQEMHCRPLGDTIAFKVITFLIDKNGKAYAKKITGYQPDCEYYIQKKIEKMPKWTPAIRNNEPVCYEEDIPVIINRK